MKADANAQLIEDSSDGSEAKREQKVGKSWEIPKFWFGFGWGNIFRSRKV
jgi:hypothetical protein